jgi:hypothetical protein
MNMIEKFVKTLYHDHVQFDHDHFYDQTWIFLWSHLKMADVNFIFINVFVQLQNQLITLYIQEEEWLISDIMTMIPNAWNDQGKSSLANGNILIYKFLSNDVE